jgi:hypothetical protein
MTTNTSLSRGAQNYIDSLISQGKIFTVKTVKNQYPDDTDAEITTYAKNAVKGQKYSTITDSTVFVPSQMFANNAATKVTPVTIDAKNSIVSSAKRMHVPLSSSVINQFRMSTRSYRYSIKGSVITIHRDSTNKKLPSFSVWKSGKAVIPVTAMGSYTVTIK